MNLQAAKALASSCRVIAQSAIEFGDTFLWETDGRPRCPIGHALAAADLRSDVIRVVRSLPDRAMALALGIVADGRPEEDLPQPIRDAIWHVAAAADAKHWDQVPSKLHSLASILDGYVVEAAA